MHRHRCKVCAAVWEHGNECYASVEAHTCVNGHALEKPWTWYRGYVPGDVVELRDEHLVVRLIGIREVDGVWLAKDSDQEWVELTESEILGRAA